MMASQPQPLSDFDYLAIVRLPNWGRCARMYEARQQPSVQAVSSIYGKGRYSWNAEEDFGTDDMIAVDWRDADLLDGYIAQLAVRHRHYIKRHYYQRLKVPRMDRDASVRALLDLIDANRETVGRMRELLQNYA